MRIFCALCGLFLAVAIVNCSPIVKRETEETLKDLDPLNEVYVFEVEDDAANGENGEREKRKIGVKLGVTNGVINFVFGKLDSFLDAKTKALAVLDESNRAKNAAFGIDPHQSATTQFINNLVSQKIKAATGSIGPVINSATTLLAGASTGLTSSLTSALASKVAPLSSLSGGGGAVGAGADAGHAGGGTGGVAGGAANSAIIGNLLTAGINTLSTLSQSSGQSGGSGGSSGTGTSGGAGAGAGINLGGFANIGGFGR